MKTEKEIMEKINKSKKDSTYFNALGISNSRMVEICKMLDERTKNKKLIFEDIVWIINNVEFTDEEKIMAILERNMRHAYFVFEGGYYKEKIPYIKLHSTIEGAMNDPD